MFGATFKATKEVVWLIMFLMGLEVVPLAISSIILFYKNEMVELFKETKNQQKRKHIEMKYYMFCDIVYRSDITME